MLHFPVSKYNLKGIEMNDFICIIVANVFLMPTKGKIW